MAAANKSQFARVVTWALRALRQIYSGYTAALRVVGAGGEEGAASPAFGHQCAEVLQECGLEALGGRGPMGWRRAALELCKSQSATARVSLCGNRAASVQACC
ncbi:hypothetical protein NDU88_006857 [Pleurodeles waltl]|uniref:Uncharacterized protein n=1 Tax=Pleurodeles waltl TaxID=8319 RepID=A0AAV7MII3_PLEWA|nr:hypothetical protein NDU88_006857 [Pleurodeles waltl]